jgi:hypothetical protein
MDVRALVVHVLHPVVGAIILDSGTWSLRATPGASAAGERRVRTGFAEDAAVQASVHTVLVALRSFASGDTVGSELRQPRPEAGIHIPLQDFCDRHDVRVDVVDLESVPHVLLLRW